MKKIALLYFIFVGLFGCGQQELSELSAESELLLHGAVMKIFTYDQSYTNSARYSTNYPPTQERLEFGGSFALVNPDFYFSKTLPSTTTFYQLTSQTRHGYRYQSNKGTYVYNQDDISNEIKLNSYWNMLTYDEAKEIKNYGYSKIKVVITAKGYLNKLANSVSSNAKLQVKCRVPSALNTRIDRFTSTYNPANSEDYFNFSLVEIIDLNNSSSCVGFMNGSLHLTSNYAGIREITYSMHLVEP